MVGVWQMFNSFTICRCRWNHFRRRERWKEVKNTAQGWAEGVWLQMGCSFACTLLPPNRVWLAHQVPQELLFLFLVLKAQTSLPDENAAKCTVCKESWTACAGAIDLVWFLFCRECELGCSPVKDQWLTKGCVVFLAFQGLRVSRENSNGVQGEFPLEGNYPRTVISSVGKVPFAMMVLGGS